MYSLQVKTRQSGSSSHSSSGKSSIQLEGRSHKESCASSTHRLDEDLDQPMSPQSWVQKIGSAMFQKIKIAPSIENPVVIAPEMAPQIPRPTKFQLHLEEVAVDDTRIAMPINDREDPKPALARSGSFGHQSLEFIKVYCSPKRQSRPSPKIKPHADKQSSPRRPYPTPLACKYVDYDKDEEEKEETTLPEVRTDVVPVLQSFFARPKSTSTGRRSSAQSVEHLIKRQEQYKRDLARHDVLRAAATNNNHIDEEKAYCKQEALRSHARSLKRQRMAQVAVAKRILHERFEMDQQLIQEARRDWEGSFEDEVQSLASAFAKVKAKHNSERPSTTAGLVVSEVQAHVERDKVLRPYEYRAQTAPQGAGRHTPESFSASMTPVSEQNSRPTTAEQTESLGATEVESVATEN